MNPLYKDVDVSTMRSMREDQGMSNSEIADALGVSRETVWKYIGSGPRKQRVVKRRPHTEPTTTNKSIEELFTRTETQVTLEGKVLTYFVFPAEQKVQLSVCMGTELDGDGVSALIEELQYIRRMYMR